MRNLPYRKLNAIIYGRWVMALIQVQRKMVVVFLIFRNQRLYWRIVKLFFQKRIVICRIR